MEAANLPSRLALSYAAVSMLAVAGPRLLRRSLHVAIPTISRISNPPPTPTPITAAEEVPYTIGTVVGFGSGLPLGGREEVGAGKVLVELWLLVLLFASPTAGMIVKAPAAQGLITGPSVVL